MVTIHTTDDLLHALAENPRWKDAVRREILTEELLNLPARFDRFVATTEAFMAEQREVNENTAGFIAEQRQVNAEQRQVNSDTANHIAELREVNAYIANIVAELRQFNAEQKEVNENTAGFIAEQRQVNENTTNFIAEQRQVNSDTANHIAELREMNARMNRRMDRMQEDSALFRGDYARRNATAEADEIAYAMGFRLSHTLTRTELREMYEAADTTGISAGTLHSFRRADLVIAVADADGDTHYIAVEISYTADERDTVRAIRNAGLLTRFTGRPAHAAVASIRNDNRIQPAIAGGQVHWYQLDDRLEPVD